MRAGPGTAEGVAVGPLIDDAALTRMSAQVSDATAHGAHVELGGRRLDGPDVAGGYFYAPTVLSGVTPDMRIYREETFGPIAPVIVWDDEDEVLAAANDTHYGLASYVYTQNLSTALRAVERLHFGMVGVNDINPTSAAAPFGGMKESGLGREGARAGTRRVPRDQARRYQHLKAVSCTNHNHRRTGRVRDVPSSRAYSIPGRSRSSGSARRPTSACRRCGAHCRAMPRSTSCTPTARPRSDGPRSPTCVRSATRSMPCSAWSARTHRRGRRTGRRDRRRRRGHHRRRLRRGRRRRAADLQDRLRAPRAAAGNFPVVGPNGVGYIDVTRAARNDLPAALRAPARRPVHRGAQRRAARGDRRARPGARAASG